MAKNRVVHERDVEAYLIAQVKKVGGTTRKVQWIGVNGAPDRLVVLPGVGVLWVEVKAPGKKIRNNQGREHALLVAGLQHVHVVDSFESIDNLIGAI